MRNPNLRNLILAALFAALIAVVAQYPIRLPGLSVPISFQPLVVFLAGGLLGSIWGAVSMLVYVLVGAVGLPVFSGGGAGLQVLVGPTGGYLFSYPLVALAIGLLAPAARAPGIVKTALALTVGLAIMYLGGAGWAIVVGGKTFGAVISGWVLPFVPLDLLKMAVAAGLSSAVNRALVAQGYWRRNAA